ncbi:MAG: sigma-70 family RNA polymerase sigma factor [Mycobacteriales bacterium]
MSDQSMTALVHGAAAGDPVAWDALVSQYSRLVWSVARAHRLSEADAGDVCQATWLRLVENLGSLREPEAVGGWLATTARRESLRVIKAAARQMPTDIEATLDIADEAAQSDPGRFLLAGERASALRAAFASLGDACRTLLTLLMTDPPVAYAEISAALEIPVGSIGPTRARCLDRLRKSPALAGINV